MSNTHKAPQMTPVVVQTEVNDEVFTGSYTYDQHDVTCSFGFSKKTTQIGGGSPENIAQQLLGELVRESLKKRAAKAK